VKCEGDFGMSALDTSIEEYCNKAPRKNHVANTKGMVRPGTLCGQRTAPNAGMIKEVNAAQIKI
jgi:hypothetical protein